jgi:16S rRNA (guanine527-N7)-methyltransferase
MTAKFLAEVRTLAETVAAEFPPLDHTKLARYLSEVVEWNDRVGLVSRRSTLPSLRRLCRESAAMYGVLKERGVMAEKGGEAVVDIGSGAGFPGVVWKLMQPTLSVALVERRRNKATFLQRTTVVLGLEGVEVIEGDATEVAQYERLLGRFDVATSLAVASPAAIARAVEPFLRPGGYYCTVRPVEETMRTEPAGKSLQVETVTHSVHGRIYLYRKGTGGDGKLTT